MSGPRIDYGCPEDVCKAIQQLPEVRDRLGTVSAHPYNQYRPRETLWWLIPPDEDGSWPAHRLGKLAFEYGAEPNQLDIGLHVEKGVSAPAAEVLGHSDDLVLTDDWMWPRFVADLRAGALTEVARGISRKTGLEVYLSFILKPQTSAGSDEIEGDVAAFDVKADRSLVASLDPPSSNLLRPFRSVASDTALGAALEKTDGFTWIDAWVAVTFACDARTTTRTRSAEVWDADRLWLDFLEPLSRWVGGR